MYKFKVFSLYWNFTLPMRNFCNDLQRVQFTKAVQASVNVVNANYPIYSQQNAGRLWWWCTDSWFIIKFWTSQCYTSSPLSLTHSHASICYLMIQVTAEVEENVIIFADIYIKPHISNSLWHQQKLIMIHLLGAINIFAKIHGLRFKFKLWCADQLELQTVK